MATAARSVSEGRDSGEESFSAVEAHLGSIFVELASYVAGTGLLPLGCEQLGTVEQHPLLSRSSFLVAGEGK